MKAFFGLGNQSIEILTVDGKPMILINGISRAELETNETLRHDLEDISKRLLQQWEQENEQPETPIEELPFTAAEIEMIRDFRQRVSEHPASATDVVVLVAKFAYRYSKSIEEASKAYFAQEQPKRADGENMFAGEPFTTETPIVNAIWHNPAKRFAPVMITINMNPDHRVEISYALVAALTSALCKVDTENKRIEIIDPTTNVVYKLRIEAQSRNLDGSYLCSIMRGE